MVQRLAKIVVILMLFISNNAFSQTWEAVFITDKSVPYFIDPASIVRVGSAIHFTQLSNYSEGSKYNGHVVYSIKVLKRANCEDASYKSGALIGYSKTYAAGEIELVDFDLSKKWRNIVPRSTAAVFQERVCGKDFG